VELSATTATPRKAGSDTPANAADSQAVKEVVEGQRGVANAAWWGGIEADQTEASQPAINFAAKRVVMSNMKKDWIGRPIQLAGNQDLSPEDAAVLTAKRGEHRSRGASVSTAQDVSNSTIRGYRATVRMTLALRGVKNVKTSGLTPCDNGNDGIEGFFAHLKGRATPEWRDAAT
jgi:hypothetical protein